MARRRRYVSDAFAGGGQQDAVQFLEQYLDRAAEQEYERGRYGL